MYHKSTHFCSMSPLLRWIGTEKLMVRCNPAIWTDDNNNNRNSNYNNINNNIINNSDTLEWPSLGSALM